VCGRIFWLNLLHCFSWFRLAEGNGQGAKDPLGCRLNCSGRIVSFSELKLPKEEGNLNKVGPTPRRELWNSWENGKKWKWRRRASTMKMSECNYRCKLLLSREGAVLIRLEDGTESWQMTGAPGSASDPLRSIPGPFLPPRPSLAWWWQCRRLLARPLPTFWPFPKCLPESGFIITKVTFGRQKSRTERQPLQQQAQRGEKWRQQQSSTVPDADVGLLRRYKWFPPDFNEMWITHSVNGFVYVFILFLNI